MGKQTIKQLQGEINNRQLAAMDRTLERWACVAIHEGIPLVSESVEAWLAGRRLVPEGFTGAVSTLLFMTMFRIVNPERWAKVSVDAADDINAMRGMMSSVIEWGAK